MKVTHVVNKDKACGYAEYGRELDFELNKEFEASITEPGQDVGDVDVIIASYGSTETLCLTPQQTDTWRSQGKKVILLHRESTGNLTKDCTIPVHHFIGHVDAMITHEPTNYDTDFIPISFPEVDNLPEPILDRLLIGEAGFWDPMKHFETAEGVARELCGNINFIVTPFGNVGLDGKWACINAMRSRASSKDLFETEFLPVPDVVRKLARSTINMFWHHPQAVCSQSTSVGMAIATKRPLIISTDRRFLVIQTQYADEVYVAETRDDCVRIAKEIWEDIQAGKPVKVPNKLYDAYNWKTCGETYRKLIHRVAGA